MWNQNYKNEDTETGQVCLWRSKQSKKIINKKTSRRQNNSSNQGQNNWRYYEPFWARSRVANFLTNIILNMKAMVIEIKRYQLRNTLIRLNHTWKTSLIISKYSKNDNKEIMIYDKAYEVIPDLFEPILFTNQTGLWDSQYIFWLCSFVRSEM